MKIQRAHFAGGLITSGRGEGGSITVVFIALLAIMMILVTAESRALIHLRREVKFLEQQQIQRLNGPQTNAAAITTETK